MTMIEPKFKAGIETTKPNGVRTELTVAAGPQFGAPETDPLIFVLRDNGTPLVLEPQEAKRLVVLLRCALVEVAPLLLESGDPLRAEWARTQE